METLPDTTTAHRTAGDIAADVMAKQPGHHGEPPSGACLYSFKPIGEDSFLTNNKELRESVHQWGMSETLSLTQVLYAPGFMPHMESSFLRQLLSFEQDLLHPTIQNKTSIETVQWEALKCTAVSMDLFDCLVEKGIVSRSGNIRGCCDEVFDGITISDKLRELLVNPESENANTIFSVEQERELLFHVFKALCVGGAVCQPNDRVEAYANATKTLYKALVSVCKDSSSGKIEVSPCKVYRIIGMDGGSRKHQPENVYSCCGASASACLFPNSKDPDSPHHVCLVVVDLGKRRASVLKKEFVSFW